MTGEREYTVNFDSSEGIILEAMAKKAGYDTVEEYVKDTALYKHPELRKKIKGLAAGLDEKGIRIPTSPLKVEPGEFKGHDLGDNVLEAKCISDTEPETYVEEVEQKNYEEEVNLDSFGSGSWLLDLNLHPDDVSLGSVLDDIHPLEPINEGSAIEMAAEAARMMPEEPKPEYSKPLKPKKKKRSFASRFLGW